MKRNISHVSLMQTALDFLYGNSRTNSSSPKYEFVALIIVLVVIFFYLLPTRSNYIFPDYYDCDNEGGAEILVVIDTSPSRRKYIPFVG